MIKGSGCIQPVGAYLGVYSTLTNTQAFRSLQQHWRGPRENTENADDLDFAQVGHGLFIILWPAKSVPEQISMMRRVWLMGQWWKRSQSINVQALNALTIKYSIREVKHAQTHTVVPGPTGRSSSISQHGGSLPFRVWKSEWSRSWERWVFKMRTEGGKEGGSQGYRGKESSCTFWGLRKSVVLEYYGKRDFSFQRESMTKGI